MNVTLLVDVWPLSESVIGIAVCDGGTQVQKRVVKAPEGSGFAQESVMPLCAGQQVTVVILWTPVVS